MRVPIDPKKLRALRELASVRLPASRELSLDEATEGVASRADRKKKKRTSSKPALKRAIEAAETCIEHRTLGRAAWNKADHRTLVGLYAVSHRHVYGVDALELETDFLAACSAAGALVRKEFDGDVSAAAHFVQWCWSREQKAERRRRSEGKTDGWRLGWRLQFSHRSLLVDYRTAGARRR